MTSYTDNKKVVEKSTNSKMKNQIGKGKKKGKEEETNRMSRHKKIEEKKIRKGSKQ